jgi:hypothetical protein
MLVGIDGDLGRIYLPILNRMISRPNAPVKRAVSGEFGIFVAKQQRPRVIDMVERVVNGLPTLIPVIGGYDTLWASITHNERVDAGASYQARQVFAGGASPAAPSATVYFNVIAVANGTLTKAKGDQSLGSTSANATTNEYTTIGLSRATADSPVGGDYTAPSSLGGTFAQIVKKTFTASGGGTAYGAGIFNSTTVSGSVLYVEDNFSSTAVLVSGDTLTVTVTINN